MNREEEAKELRQFDIRTVERYIRRGVVGRKDYDKYLKSLPDVTDKVAPHEAPETMVETEQVLADAPSTEAPADAAPVADSPDSTPSSNP